MESKHTKEDVITDRVTLPVLNRRYLGQYYHLN